MPDSNHKIVVTKDGSTTLYHSTLKEHYHSTYGAIQESKHVFIQTGLDLFVDCDSPVNIFEVGFGTGLNAILSYAWSKKYNKPISYHCIELYPISVEQAKELNYPETLKIRDDNYIEMHKVRDELVMISDLFSFKNEITSLQDVVLPGNHFDLVYFDAFSPEVQPELWTDEMFQKIASSMKRGGVLTTYSCKGIVKRSLKAAGFEIEKLPGPAGKREILRAIKNN